MSPDNSTQNESISEKTIREIVRQFEDGLRRHLFSDHSYPVSVTVETHYKESAQTLTIHFE